MKLRSGRTLPNEPLLGPFGEHLSVTGCSTRQSGVTIRLAGPANAPATIPAVVAILATSPPSFASPTQAKVCLPSTIAPRDCCTTTQPIACCATTAPAMFGQQQADIFSAPTTAQAYVDSFFVVSLFAPGIDNQLLTGEPVHFRSLPEPSPRYFLACALALPALGKPI